MIIVNIQPVEDCFDGSSVLGYSFDEPWTKESIFRLKAMGKLDYFPEFPRPFFRLRGDGGLQIKGVQGENSCRVIFPKNEKEALRRQFENLFAQ